MIGGNTYKAIPIIEVKTKTGFCQEKNRL